ncbi:MAG: hypothetical protein IKD78_01200 [Bacteroidales bacterium]|nr:hypothetical protein [Bacteroidales bacterium]
MKKNEWFNEYGYLAKPIPPEAVDACSHSGSCDADVKHWVKELKFEVPDLEAARKFVKSTGADDYDMMDEDDMNEFVFWEFCNRIREEEYDHKNHPDENEDDEDDFFEAWAFCSLDC